MDREDISKMRVVDLRRELKQRGAPVGGRKSVLVQRLRLLRSKDGNAAVRTTPTSLQMREMSPPPRDSPNREQNLWSPPLQTSISKDPPSALKKKETSPKRALFPSPNATSPGKNGAFECLHFV